MKMRSIRVMGNSKTRTSPTSSSTRSKVKISSGSLSLALLQERGSPCERLLLEERREGYEQEPK
jgi:hypothetical protein